MPNSNQIWNQLIQPVNNKKVLKIIRQHIPETDETLIQIVGNCDQTLLLTKQHLYTIKPGFQELISNK